MVCIQEGSKLNLRTSDCAEGMNFRSDILTNPGDCLNTGNSFYSKIKCTDNVPKLKFYADSQCKKGTAAGKTWSDKECVNLNGEWRELRCNAPGEKGQINVENTCGSFCAVGILNSKDGWCCDQSSPCAGKCNKKSFVEPKIDAGTCMENGTCRKASDVGCLLPTCGADSETTILYARHGESIWNSQEVSGMAANVSRKIFGLEEDIHAYCDSPLLPHHGEIPSDKWHESLPGQLEGVDFTRIQPVSSPLGRAYNTQRRFLCEG
eukprot:UN32205